MTDTPRNLTPEDAALAAELALSLLEGEERAEAEARLAIDPAFAAEVARWQSNLAEMADAQIEPVEVPNRVRRRIRHRIGIGSGWMTWVNSTLGGLAGLAVATALLVLALNFGLLNPARDFEASARLDATSRVLSLDVRLDEDTATLFLERLDGSAAAPGRATELWAIPGDGVPVSLGLVPAEDTWQVTLPADLEGEAAGLTLAISDEPPGGSPTGAPTGEVLAAAALVRL